MTSLFSLVLLAPFVAVLCLLIWWDLKGNPLYFVKRPGKNEQLFWFVKLRTMTNKVDANGSLLTDGERLTKVGKWVRASSLDELPQLYNVLTGDMSLVGPRPLAVEYLELYSEEHRRRHSVRPGITGWAQVNGRNDISWSRKFELDNYYVDNLSFGLDLKILLLTFLKVIKREGVKAEGQAIVESFNGKN